MSTDVKFYGLYQLIGQTVAVVVAGLDCGDFVVSNLGVVDVPLQSDPDGLFTGDYLQQFDVGPWNQAAYGSLTTSVTMLVGGNARKTMYLPVFIGYSYLSAGQLMRPVTPEQTKSGQGGGPGKNRRVFNWAALVQGTTGLSVGTNFSNLQPVVFKTAGGQVLNHQQLFSGEVFGTTQDRNTMDGRLCWTIQRPYPCVINAMTGFMETDERSVEANAPEAGSASPTTTEALTHSASPGPMGGEEVPGR